MPSLDRIPVFINKSFEGMQTWFGELDQTDLLFHPDDLPQDIVEISSGEPLFTSEESNTLEGIIAEMFDLFGDRVYEAAYPYFMSRMKLER